MDFKEHAVLYDIIGESGLGCSNGQRSMLVFAGIVVNLFVQLFYGSWQRAMASQPSRFLVRLIAISRKASHLIPVALSSCASPLPTN